MKLLLDWFVALAAPPISPFAPSLADVPVETLANIVHQDNFESVSSLVQVNRRFRQEIPRMCYYQFLEETEAFHQSMAVNPSFRPFKCNYALWAAVHLVEASTSRVKIIDGLAHFFTFAGTSPSISERLVRLLIGLTPRLSDKRHFAKRLQKHFMAHYNTIQWILPSHAFSFLTTEPSFESSYHIPLLALGVHPFSKDVLAHCLASQLTKPRIEIDGVEKFLVDRWSIIGLMKKINPARVCEPILSLADFFYLLSGDQWLNAVKALEKFAAAVMDHGLSLCYSESLFEMRMSDPNNAYGLLITLEYVALPEDYDTWFIDLLRHPSLVDYFRIFEEAFDDLINERPVNPSAFCPLMRRAFQNYVIIRTGKDSEFKLQRIFWSMKDSVQTALCAECLPYLDYKYFIRYGNIVGPSTPIASAFNEFHWQIILVRCIFDTGLFAFVTGWIHRDIVEFILEGHCQVVDSYKTAIASLADFRRIFGFACMNLKRRRLISEDEFWKSGHILGIDLNVIS